MSRSIATAQRWRAPARRWAARLWVARLWMAALCLSGTAVMSWAQPPNAERFDGLTVEMSAEERQAAGIYQLNEAQLNFLNGWLRSRFNQIEQDVAAETQEAEALEREAEIQRRVAAEVAEVREQVRDEVRDEVRVAMKEEDASRERQEPFEANITGSFTGWSGRTVFPLDNGQVWRQRHGSSYRHLREDSRVRFDTNIFGMWEMKVISSGRTVPVKRID